MVEYSRAAVEALHREGFEALTASRPHPSTDPSFPVQPLAGWNPLELLDGGFPILPRIHIDDALELGVLRAFLDQPLVFYGHHQDLAEDPDRLSDLARAIDRLGVSSWGRLDTITRKAVSTRLDGETFWVRPFARKVSVRVPAEAQTIQIEVPETANSVLTRRASEDRVGWRAGEILEDPGLGGDLVEIVLEAPASPELPPASRSGWPPIRRVMTEARDRAQALTPGESARLAHAAESPAGVISTAASRRAPRARRLVVLARIEPQLSAGQRRSPISGAAARRLGSRRPALISTPGTARRTSIVLRPTPDRRLIVARCGSQAALTMTLATSAIWT